MIHSMYIYICREKSHENSIWVKVISSKDWVPKSFQRRKKKVGERKDWWWWWRWRWRLSISLKNDEDKTRVWFVPRWRGWLTTSAPSLGPMVNGLFVHALCNHACQTPALMTWKTTTTTRPVSISTVNFKICYLKL